MNDAERYIVVDGRRWRRADPAIPESLRKQLVRELMAARRAVKSALSGDRENDLRAARRRVQDAKVALGERGRPWWQAPEAEAQRERLAAAMRALLESRDGGKTICPSEPARVAGGANWRELMPLGREVAWELARDGSLEVVQRGSPVTPPVSGPIRLRKAG